MGEKHPSKRATDGPPEVEHIRDLVPDRRNARRHSPRNLGEIGDSLAAVGAARSIVIDEENVVLAGNGLVEAAAERGITKVQVVEADGETVIAVRRRGLSRKQKAELAIRDNRSAESAGWDVPMLETLAEEHELDLGALGFTGDELTALADDGTGEPDGDGGTGDDPGEGRYREQFGVVVMCASEEEQQRVFETLRAQYPDNQVKVVTT